MPLMDFSREVLAALHNDLYMFETGNSSLSSRDGRNSVILQASARTGR
jgi:hypothetical protein